MFRLVLDYPYTHIPAAIDVSGANNHGTSRDVAFVSDGLSKGSGALVFHSPASRVRVPNNPVFQHLHALKLETVVRLDRLGQRQNLIEGHLSFAFFVRPDGVLEGTAFGRQTPAGPKAWQGVNSASDSPDGVARMVPIGQWVNLRYEHDGFASIRLFIDDQLAAATYSIASPIRPVGSHGVHIGNWPDADVYTFAGLMDRVRIWRWDPDAAYQQFFCRAPGRCWTAIDSQLGQWADGPDGRERLRSLLQCIGDIQYRIINVVRGAGEDAIKANEEFGLRYRRL